MFKTQPNAVIHLILACIAISLGWYLSISFLEWIILILTITLVIALEAVNTAIEFLTDLASPNFHPLAGKAKDVAAAAVLIGAIGALAVGVCLFLPKILAL